MQSTCSRSVGVCVRVDVQHNERGACIIILSFRDEKGVYECVLHVCEATTTSPS